MKKITAALALTGLLGFGSAQAGVITSTKSVALAPTDWAEILSFAKFDTSLGTLDSVEFFLSGTTSGVAQAEHKGPFARDITLNISTILTLTRPDATTLVVATPVFSEIFHATSFDGNKDFAGTSGITTATKTATGTNSITYTDISDLLLFSGSGTINLGLGTAGNSTATGSGNMTSDFTTSASGYATVTYHYTSPIVPPAPVPEPASFAVMGLGLGMLGLTRRRRSSKAT